MPAKVLFTHSYFLAYDPKQQMAMQPYAPLATLYAMSVLRDAGFEVRLHDVMFEAGPEGLEEELQAFQPDYLVLYDDSFNWLTKMCLSNMQKAAFAMMAMGKAFGCTVIASSSDASDHRKRYLEEQADFVLIGEAEYTLLELIECLERQGEAAQVPGLVFLEGDTLVSSPPRKVLRDLDALPLPAWDLFDFSRYEQAWREHHGYFSVNLVTTRGCPYKCNWCAKPIYGQRYNSHSPQRIVASIQKLKEHISFEHIWFGDDIFGLKPRWVQEFNRCIQEAGIDIRYKIQSRVDLLLSDDTIDCLAQSGLETVWVGAESGSQKILDAMDKGTRVEQIGEARRLLKEHGIRVGFFLQFGYLGEDKQDIAKTLDMVLEHMPDEIGISVSYPLPGTKFYDRVAEQLRGKTNWTDSDDLAMLYRATFHPDYYRVLHRYVHLRYGLRKNFTALGQFLKKPFGRNKPSLTKVLRGFVAAPRALVCWFKMRRLEAKPQS